MKRLDKQAVELILAGQHTIITGSHFVYAQPKGRGDHGDTYVNKDAIYPSTSAVSALCYEMAHRAVSALETPPECVVGPEKGGIILSQCLAHWFNEEWPVAEGDPETLSLYAEKREGGGFELRRGYDKLVRGRRTLVVEDILNTGGSAKETIEAVQRAGGIVIGVSAICNRGGVTAESLDVPYLDALVSIPDLKKYPEDSCPLCIAGIPVREDLGHGREFLARKKACVAL